MIITSSLERILQLIRLKQICKTLIKDKTFQETNMKSRSILIRCIKIYKTLINLMINKMLFQKEHMQTKRIYKS